MYPSQIRMYKFLVNDHVSYHVCMYGMYISMHALQNLLIILFLPTTT